MSKRQEPWGAGRDRGTPSIPMCSKHLPRHTRLQRHPRVSILDRPGSGCQGDGLRQAFEVVSLVAETVSGSGRNKMESAASSVLLALGF